MKTRWRAATAVLVSLLAHGAVGWSLSCLRYEAAPAVPRQAAVHTSIWCPAASADKLVAGDSGPSAPIVTLTPTPPEVVVTVSAMPAAPLGHALPGVQLGPPQGNAGSGGSGGVGVPQGATTAFFGIPARGQSVVWLLDRSCSMGMQGALGTARRELVASLQALPATARFQVVLYNSSARPLLGRQDELLPATSDNLRRAAEALATFEPEGDTRHYPGFLQALNLRPDVLYFLTDADDLNDADERAILQLNAGRTVIHTIELTLAHQGQPAKAMQRLARATGGTYRALDLSGPR